MTVAISVITCSHNPRAPYVTRVVEALRAQTLDKADWEYLLVDNASETPLSGTVDLTWHPSARHVREEQVGLTHARLRGIAEARGELLIFVDDDNVLDADYLQTAVAIARDYPMLGAWSGQCRGEFEVAPPDWTTRYLGLLCVRRVERDYWCNFPFETVALPTGAGLCIRASAAREYARIHQSGGRPFTLGRNGAALLSGEDNDMALTCADLGLGVGVFSRLCLTHLIPASRLDERYLLRLTRDMAFSSVILDYYRPGTTGTSQTRLRTRVANAARMTLLPRRERRFFRATQAGLSAGRAAIKQLRHNGTSEHRDGAAL